MIATNKCLWGIMSKPTSGTWSFGCMRAVYTTTICATTSLLSSILSPGTRKVLHRGRSRVQSPLELCTPRSVTRHSWKDFKWVIRSNQIKDCPVTVQDADVALKIWGKNSIAALKGKSTRSKHNPVGKGFCESPRGADEGDIPVLPPLWISHHNGACGWGTICLNPSRL
jgi:hypothetical protein